ncbi:amidase signature domain-containing protein [Kockiozyma suomiensis]|uniref:amidase signature domain-containing protein n=1 Tax=Kockiozyma suomiensis TaxID=1337062 RepID=UPI0033435B2B
MSEPAYKSISAAKKQSLIDAIPAEWRVPVPKDQDNLTKFAETTGVLTPKEVEITSKYDAVALLGKVHAGELTALEVTIAFCKRAALAHLAINCCTEIFFERAYEVAKKQDAYFAANGKPVGPLHGLPVSIKDSYNLKGIDSSIGMCAWVGKPEPESSAIVDALEAAGAIMYVKTTVPQSMMVLDTENNLTGACRNPYSKYMTAAGSSGGAGAIVAFRGSLVGMATDIGGSIRVPAYANGAFGIKPSSGRNPYHNIKGYWPDGEDVTGILCVDGPITTSARDLELILKSIAEQEPWLTDPSCARLPWVEPENLDRPLRIGVISSVKTYEPITSIFSDFKNKVIAAGHELVEIDLLKVKELADVATSFFKADGGVFLQQVCASVGEPLTEAVLNGGLYPCEPIDLNQFWALSHKRAALQKEWLEYWLATASKTKDGEPVDVILLPAQPQLPRPKEPMASDTVILAWNTCDYPAAIFPVETIDLSKKDYKFEFPTPATSIEVAYDKLFPEDRSKAYDGFPVGLQLVGRKQDEPKLLQAVKMLSALAQ